MSRPGRFLVTLSGARPDILAFCPGERTKFQNLGWMILITAGIAVVSMWFALTSALDVNAVAAVFGALLWGLVIMGVDRWLVTSMPNDRSRKFLMAIPRLLLGLLLGSIISTPFVLRVFQSEINNQISIIKENSEAKFLNSQQHSQIAARVTTWTKTVDNLQQVIDSRGQQAINPASDPEIQNLNKQLSTARSTASSDYKAWQCQLYGGCGAPKGSGPLAAASKARYESDESQISQLTKAIQARETQLQDNSVAAQQTRLQQAQGALPNARAQLAAAQGEENSLTKNFEATNNATNGLLIRLQALDQLSSGSASLNMARFLLFLLFLLIECLPVTVKLLQRPGNYEKILAATAKRELNRAHKNLREEEFRERTEENTRFSSGPGQSWYSPGGPGREPSGAGNGSGGYSGTREYPTGGWRSADSIDTKINNIWTTGSRPTRTMTEESWQSSAPGGEAPYGSPPGEPTEPSAAGPTRDEGPLNDVTDLDGGERPDPQNGSSRFSEGIDDLYGEDEI